MIEIGNKERKNDYTIYLRWAIEMARIGGFFFYDIILGKLTAQEWLELTNITTQWDELPKDFEHPVSEDPYWIFFKEKTIEERARMSREFLSLTYEKKSQLNVLVPSCAHEMLEDLKVFYLNKNRDFSQGDIITIALNSLIFSCIALHKSDLTQ